MGLADNLCSQTHRTCKLQTAICQLSHQIQLTRATRDSESLTDSVQNFPEEFGRTYHAYRAGCKLEQPIPHRRRTDVFPAYAFPNDELERERLELQNEALVKLFGGRLFFAPLSERAPPVSILDIATGTGDWAIKMGDLFPHAEVIATDLSPIQPRNVPPNVNFFVEDSYVLSFSNCRPRHHN